jgi:hypothetical protein
MLRLAKYLITLPLLTPPLFGAAPELHADPVMTQLDALRLLAKSRAVDNKCKILGPVEADELNAYLARAEIAAASRHSVSEAQSSISLGKALGDTAACTHATSQEVGATLAAARHATAAARQPRFGEEQEKAELVESPPPGREALEPQESYRITLASYGRHALAYYVERRCEYLSRRDTRAFWAAIVREHKAALSAHGGPAVAGTLRRARARAEEIGCDAAGRQLVRAEYTRLARN